MTEVISFTKGKARAGPERTRILCTLFLIYLSIHRFVELHAMAHVEVRGQLSGGGFSFHSVGSRDCTQAFSSGDNNHLNLLLHPSGPSPHALADREPSILTSLEIWA